MKRLLDEFEKDRSFSPVYKFFSGAFHLAVAVGLLALSWLLGEYWLQASGDLILFGLTATCVVLAGLVAHSAVREVKSTPNNRVPRTSRALLGFFSIIFLAVGVAAVLSGRSAAGVAILVGCMLARRAVAGHGKSP